MQIFTIALILHITAGTLALLAGPFAMYYQDAGKIHRNAGKIFFWSMMMVSLSGFILSSIKSNLFLLMISVFAFYLTFTGNRVLHMKKLHRGTKPAVYDWAILIICSLFGIGLMAFGINGMRTNSFGIVAVVFGFILFMRTRSDYKRFTRDNGDRKTWLYVHIGNMIGAYIAAFTAFLVQNVHTEPAFIAWLAPTLVLVPLIYFTIRKFKKGRPAPASRTLKEG